MSLGTEVLRVFATLGIDTSKYEQGLKESETKASKFGSTLKSGLAKGAKVAAGAVAAGSTAVVAFGKKAVDAGRNFDSSMSQVAATMGVSTDEIEELRNYAQEMGRTTAFSASQSADALNYMALAGYDAEKSMKMLPNVLNLAAAGNMELATASDMVTDAQSALGLSTEDTTKMVDQMAKTSSKSNTSVSQLGDAILTIGATAQSIKGGTTELNTLLGVLADNGIKGAEGGTHLRNMILSLTNPTTQTTKMLDKLGVEVYDTEGNMRSMVDIIQDLQKKTENLTAAEKDLAIGTIFNRADMASVNALLGTTGERFDELTGEIENAQGSAEKMANTQLDNLSGDVTLFKSALEGAQIAVSDKLTPSLRDFVQFGTSGLSRVTEAFQKGGLSGAFSELGNVISEGLGMITEKAPELIQAGVNLLGALGQGLVDNAPMIFSTVVPQLINAGIQLASQAGSAIVQLLPMVTQAAFDILNMLTTALIDNVDTFIPQLVSMLTQIAQIFAENAPVMIPKIVELITTIATILSQPETLVPLIDAAGQIIIALVQGIGAAIPQLIIAGIDIVNNLASSLVQAIPILITTIGGIVVEMGRALGNGLYDVNSHIVETIKDNITKVKAFFSAIPEFFKRIGLVVVNMYDNILNGIKNKIESIKEFFRDQIEKIKGFFSGLKFEFPKIKLPHFKLEGEFSLAPPKVPTLGIDWYAKGYDEAYMLNSAAIFGAQGGKLLGGGERAGSEVVVGTQKLISMMSTAVRNAFDGVVIEANIPVYIGNKKLEDIIVKTQATMKIKRGK